MKRLIQDGVVTIFGLVTTSLTTVILLLVRLVFGVAIDTLTICLIAPAGAIGAGFLAASGYYVGARLLDHRPGLKVLVNMVAASIGTFFLIRYFEYAFLVVGGTRLPEMASFREYLLAEFARSSVRFLSRPGRAAELGQWGYAYAVVQVVGFALGGTAVYGWLASQPYCERCSKYLTRKGKEARYSGNRSALAEVVSAIRQSVGDGNLQEAIDRHANYGYSGGKHAEFRSTVEVRYCKKCGRHWFKFTVDRRAKDDWKEISGLGLERFTNEKLCL